MIQFQCDYVSGCHQKILDRLVATNMEQTEGYGTDHYCQSAREKILHACQCPQGEVQFMVGGTQANTAVIASLLRPYQGVISSDEGHIAAHETGAIEATGHKILALPNYKGTISAQQIEHCIRTHAESEIGEHLVEPGMVYISYPTEQGTLYSKKALQEISVVCQRWNVPLFVDGARLGYGLMSPESDLTLPELAALCDVFYIGGTKCGTLFGEAVVFTNAKLAKGFRSMIKRGGGMLAKGRLLGIQFDTMFTDNLYFDICKSACGQAMKIRQAFIDSGIEMVGESPTNQQFVALTQAQADILGQNFLFERDHVRADGLIVVRFCTSWATRDEDIAVLVEHIAQLKG